MFKRIIGVFRILMNKCIECGYRNYRVKAVTKGGITIDMKECLKCKYLERVY